MKRAFLLAFLLPIALTATSARSQDDAPAAAGGIPKGISRPRQESEYLFYRNIFFRLAPSVPISQGSATTVLNAARSNSSTQLILQIDDIHRQFPLTEAQKKKLQAAGELDIRRFFDRIEQAKSKYFDILDDPAQGRVIMADRQHLVRDFEAGLFGPGSFFEKILKTAIDEKQFDKLHASREWRGRRRWKAQALAVAQAWGETIGMADEQMRKLSELIVAEIPPPAKASMADYYFILYKLDQLPRDELRPIFDDAQWKIFSRQLSTIKAVRKDFLVEFGYDLGETTPVKPNTEPAK